MLEVADSYIKLNLTQKSSRRRCSLSKHPADGLKDQVLIAIAKQQAKAGQYGSAIQVANTITDARQRNPLLQLITCANQTALLSFKIQN